MVVSASIDFPTGYGSVINYVIWRMSASHRSLSTMVLLTSASLHHGFLTFRGRGATRAHLAAQNHPPYTTEEGTGGFFAWSCRLEEARECWASPVPSSGLEAGVLRDWHGLDTCYLNRNRRGVTGSRGLFIRQLL
jgi:hypothetical protein